MKIQKGSGLVLVGCTLIFCARLFADRAGKAPVQSTLEFVFSVPALMFCVFGVIAVLGGIIVSFFFESK